MKKTLFRIIGVTLLALASIYIFPIANTNWFSFSSQVVGAQQPVINLGIGNTMIQANATPSTTAASFILSFPPNAQYFAIVAQPHTTTGTTGNIAITLAAWGNSSLQIPSASSFSIGCFIGGGGNSNINPVFPNVQNILLATSTAAGIAWCPTPPTGNAQLTIVASVAGGATYDLYAYSSPNPITQLCIVAQNPSLCSSLSQGLDGNGNTISNFICNRTTFISALGATTTQIIALSGTTQIRVCHMSISNNSATAMNVTFVQGTGANCATGQSTLTGKYLLNANTLASDEVEIALGNGSPLTLTAGQALCATGSAAGSSDITVSFAQF